MSQQPTQTADNKDKKVSESKEDTIEQAVSAQDLVEQLKKDLKKN